MKELPGDPYESDLQVDPEERSIAEIEGIEFKKNAHQSNRRTEAPERDDRAHTLALMCSNKRGN